MTDPLAHRPVLGAAQLGLAYGIANRNPGPADAPALLAAAEAAGLRTVDTAPHYGTSEDAIGGYLRANPDSRLEVVSKLHPDIDAAAADVVHESVAGSRALIGRPLAALLVHRAEHLAAWDGPVGDGLRRARDAGLTRVLGASVYTPEDFARALEIPDVRHIQAPFNLLDRRLLTTGLLDRAAERGVTVHLRSLLLQGLLAMDRLPPRMAFATPAVDRVGAVCRRHGVTPTAAALAWAARRGGAAGLVIGCDGAGQLRDSLALLAGAGISDACLADLDDLPQADPRVINPALWPREAA